MNPSVQLSRRRIVTIGGTALALGATGLALGTQQAGATATVTLGELSVPDETLNSEDGEIYAPHILVSGSYEYVVQNTPATWEVLLLVGDGSGNMGALALKDGSLSNKSGSGTYDIRGAITDDASWSSSDFTAASDGSPQDTVVPIAVKFLVKDSNGDILVETQVSRDVTITVDQTGASASVGGDGVVAGQDDQSDPTPTPLP